MATFVVRNEKGESHEVDEANVQDAAKDGFNIVVSNGKEDHLVPYENLGQAKKDGFWPTDKKTFSEKAMELVGDAGEVLDETINRTGYGQIKNVASLFTGLKDRTDPQSYSDAFYGTNAPTAKQVLDSSFLPRAPLQGVANTENVYSLKTTPRLSQDEQWNLRQVDTGIDTNDVLGFGADFAAGDAAFKAGGALLKTAKNVGPAISKGVDAVADFIRPAEAKINAKEIAEAAKKLDIKITPGMLDESGFVERLENELSKSPSFWGQSIAKRQKQVIEGLKKVVDDVTSGRGTMTPKELGEAVQDGVVGAVESRMSPISKTFDDVRASTQNIPVGERSVAAIVRNIEEIPAYRLTGGAGKPAKYVEMVQRAQNADDLKTIMTMMGDDLANPSLDSAEKFVLRQMKEKISRLESNSVTRAAIQISKDTATSAKTGVVGKAPKLLEQEAKEAAKEVVENLGQARKGFREFSGEVTDIAKDAKMAKSLTPNEFVAKVENLAPEEVSGKLFKPNNQRLLDNLKKTFPKEFELLRQGKLKELYNAAVDSTLNGQGRVSAQRFLNEIADINPEGMKSIFGAQGVEKINNLRTVQQSIPRNFNTSNTASSQSWQEAIWRNVKDIPTYVLYKGASSNLANNIRGNLLKIPKVFELSKSDPKQFDSLVNSLAKSGNRLNAVAGSGTKAPQIAEGQNNEANYKWIQNGIKKIAASGQIFTNLDSIKSDKEVSSLLLRAASANDEELKKIAEQIKNTEAFKKAPKSGPKTSNKYPKVLKNNGMIATVFSDADYYEAKSEGWV